GSSVASPQWRRPPDLGARCARSQPPRGFMNASTASLLGASDIIEKNGRLSHTKWREGGRAGPFPRRRTPFDIALSGRPWPASVRLAGQGLPYETGSPDKEAALGGGGRRWSR